jgi:hypothetical protein
VEELKRRLVDMEELNATERSKLHYARTTEEVEAIGVSFAVFLVPALLF